MVMIRTIKTMRVWAPLQGRSHFALHKGAACTRFFDRIAGKFGLASAHGNFPLLLFLKNNAASPVEKQRLLKKHVKNYFYSYHLNLFIKPAQNLKMMLNHSSSRHEGVAIYKAESTGMMKRVNRSFNSNSYSGGTSLYESTSYEGSKLIWNENAFYSRRTENLSLVKNRIFSLVQRAGELINHFNVNKTYLNNPFQAGFQREEVLKNISPHLSFKTEKLVQMRSVVKGKILSTNVSVENQAHGNRGIHSPTLAMSPVEGVKGSNTYRGERPLFYSLKESESSERNPAFSRFSQAMSMTKEEKKVEAGRQENVFYRNDNSLFSGSSLFFQNSFLQRQQWFEKREKKVFQTVAEVVNKNKSMTIHKMDNLLIDYRTLKRSALHVDASSSHLERISTSRSSKSYREEVEGEATFTTLFKGGQKRELHIAGALTTFDKGRGQAVSPSYSGFPGMEFKTNSLPPVMLAESEKEAVINKPSETASADHSHVDETIKLKNMDISRITDQVYRALEKRIRVEKEWRSSF